MPELVSGWSDDNHVYLVSRDGDRVSYQKHKARWSAFFSGLNQEDREALQHHPDVVGLWLEGPYVRVDFRNFFARRSMCWAVKKRIEENGPWEDPGDGSLPPAVLEADVMPLRRLLSDAPGLQVSQNPRTGWFDLETDSRKTFPQAVAGEARILCWSLWDAQGNHYEAVLEADTDVAERALLQQLLVLFESFDVLVAWNGDYFDFPTLKERCKKLKVKMPKGGSPLWARWCFLDAMEVFKKYNQAHESGEERTSVSLNAVANHLLGEGKTDFDPSRTWYAWEAGGAEREQLVVYCSQDTRLMPLIEKKTGYIALHFAVAHVTRCFPDSRSLSAVAQGDGLLLSLGAQNGYRFPTKWYEDDVQHDPFAGAYVMPPKKLGAIDNVHVCDFAGLYPSIMRSWNMSVDTLLPRRVKDTWTAGLCKLPDRGIYFRTDKRGIVPLALDQLVAKRAEYTKRADEAKVDSEEWHMFKRLSSAFKIIANSFYGIVGSPWSRFFQRDIAEGVTQTGAWLIKHVAATLEAAGIFAFYGDTDSVFGQGEMEVFARVVKQLNSSWAEVLKGLGCLTSYLKLEFEKSFKRLILKSAKCYAAQYLIYKGKPAPADMKPEVRGLEYKRGDTIRLAREMQYQAIQLLLRPQLPTAEEMATFVQGWRERLLVRELSLEDVTLSQSVKNLDDYSVRYTTAKCSSKAGTTKSGKASCGYAFPGVKGTEVGEGYPEKCPRCHTPRKLANQPVHVRVARLLEKRGHTILPGMRVEYVFINSEEATEEEGLAVPASDPGVLAKVDRDKYWDKRVYPATERLLEVVYPELDWRDTEAKRRKAVEAERKEQERLEKRNKVSDLPLFGTTTPQGYDPTPYTPAEPVSNRLESSPAAPPEHEEEEPVRIRRRSPSLRQKASTGAGRVLVKLKGEPEEVLLTALAAAAKAHPGDSEVVVELQVNVDGKQTTTTIRTKLRVASTCQTRAAFERLVGADMVSGLPTA